MGTYTRAKTKRQRYHSASRSASSQADKVAGERRRCVEFIGVPAPFSPSPERDFSEYLTGHEFKRTDAGWTRCIDPEEYGAYLDAEAKRRSWFYDTTTRKGKLVRMRRKVGTPVEIVTVTFPPWVCAWAYAELRAGRVQQTKSVLARIRNRTVENACAMFAADRFVLGEATHVNTSDLHFDYALSRQDGVGGRLGTSSSLMLVGPWAVGCDRQVRAGAEISAKKKQHLQRSVIGFRRRYGDDAVPLDIRLARDLDNASLEIIGDALVPFIERYAAQVPALERAHNAAALAVLDAVRARITNEVRPTDEVADPAAPSPASRPSPGCPSL